MQSLRFVPFCSFMDPAFWSELTERKLHQYRLDMTPKPLVAYYVNADLPGVPCRLSIDFNAFQTEHPSCPPKSFHCKGDLLITNTLEQFKELDRKQMLLESAHRLWGDIRSGRWMTEPECLAPFILTVFADLKKYHYHYWLACPALCFPDSLSLVESAQTLSKDSALFQSCAEFQRANGSPPAFLIDGIPASKHSGHKLEKIADPGFDCSRRILVVCDPSTQEHPGWPLRNLLAAFAYQRPELSKLRVLCLRQRYVNGQPDMSQSLLLCISYKRPAGEECPKVVGWEKNDAQQQRPRFVDMSSSMDPMKQAEGAVDLNLQLMRWRLVPDLQLKRMKDLKCLLFGAGTLGCNVARCLMGWGVANITFIDNGRVSVSNPVRQSLFKFTDALNGGKFKSEAAAEALKEIYPCAQTQAFTFTVPMPGHILTENEQKEAHETVKTVEKLVAEHDVIFMLLDTREGRWLPTVLAAAYQKLAMSVALGFDSYVIIRHGLRGGQGSKGQESTRAFPAHSLGCYFCSDVTAPGNSVHDRTIDQQCTVSRPGVSMLAAGLAVELLSALMQHPHGPMAGADLGGVEEEGATQSCLGSVPHQIRGYLNRFGSMTPAVKRFQSCIACSDFVVNSYREKGFGFLAEVFNDPVVLEKLTGLEDLQASAEEMEILEFDDSESVSSLDSKS